MDCTLSIPFFGLFFVFSGRLDDITSQMSRVLLTIDKKTDEWIPVSMVRSSLEPRVYLLRTELAPSGRARCRKCSDLIPKKELRVGFPTKHSNGQFGYISMWSHLKCTRVGELLTEEEIATFDADLWVYGMTDLSQADREAVSAELRRTDIPSHIEVLDPNDPTFLARPVLTRTPTPKQLTVNLLGYQVNLIHHLLDVTSHHTSFLSYPLLQ